MNLPNKLKKNAAFALYLAVFYFLLRQIFQSWQLVRSATVSIRFGWVALSLILAIGLSTFQSFVWHRILLSSNKKISYRETYRTFSRSIVTRYLPGGIWVFFARTYVTARLGFSKAQVLYLVIVESTVGVLTGCCVYIVAQPWAPHNAYLLLLAQFLVVVVVVFLSIPDKCISLLKIVLKKELTIVPIAIKDILRICILFFVQWVLVGACVVACVHAFVSLPPSLLPSVVGLYAISWVIGFVVIFAPSGIGVREGVLIMLLNLVIANPVAIISAIFIRIVMTFGELTNFLVGLVLKNAKW
jgi:glycosyltransferase 2 family protein